MSKPARPTLLGLLMAGIIPVLGTSTAMAVSIDFADGSWNGAHGNTNFSQVVSGITVGLSATGGNMTVNPGDGLGINNDEITSRTTEILTISFAGPVTLQTVDLTDLYRLDFIQNFSLRDERGWYSINGGSPSSFTAVGLPLITNGELTLNLNATDVHSISFWANNDRGSDYSVRGLTYNSVPEPSTLLLLGFGFIAAAMLYRRGYFPSI